MNRLRALVAITLLLAAVTAMAPARAATVPSAPRTPAATSTATSVKVSWTAPSSTGGSAIVGYVVQRRVGTSSTWTTVARPAASARSWVDVNDTASPLKPGTRYSYRVQARNGVGTGPASPTVATTPFAPTAPRSPTATAQLVRVDLAWLSPATTGGTPINAYLVQRRNPGSTTWVTIATRPAGGTSYSDANDAASPVAAGSTYGYRVLARNTGGTSTPSAIVSATPFGCPTNATSTLYVDPTATRVGIVPATGVSEPAACAFSRITDALPAAAAGGITEIRLAGGTAEAPAVYAHEEFPLTLPPGVNLLGEPSDAGRPDILFTGPVAYALDVNGSTVSGVTITNARGATAGQMAICTGGTNTFDSVVLTGSGGAPIDRGLWVWPGCTLDLVGSQVSHFDGDGVVSESGSSLTLDASEVSFNVDDGVVVRGTLTGGAQAASRIGWNGDDGILIEESESAEIVNAIINSNGDNGVEVHPSKTSILMSVIYNNSRSAGWSQPQVLFIGQATDGPLVHREDTQTDEPAYVVSAGSFAGCPGTRITGYDQASPFPGAVGIRAEEGAVVDARFTSWLASPKVSVSPGSYVLADSPCASVGPVPPD